MGHFFRLKILPEKEDFELTLETIEVSGIIEYGH